LSKTVLITGAEGNIGSRLREDLAGIYTLRLVSLEPIPGVSSTVADITDIFALKAACQGVDSVIHLAGDPSAHASWDSVLHNNITGTYSVFEAAHQAGVKQIIYASSNHAVGTYEQAFEQDLSATSVIDHLVPVRPDSLYGVSKCFGEALGRYYADHLGMRVICLRIGWINKDDRPPSEPLEMSARKWQSHRDFAQMVQRCLEADHIKFDIFYGLSQNPLHFFDLEHARQVLGYEPQDSSVNYTE
jgi:nucleoside-diphosphate-sugar epimerase